jgi:hypothetical protein
VKSAGLCKNIIDQGGRNAMIYHRKKANLLESLTQLLSRTLMPDGVRVRRAAEIKNGKVCHDRYSL